MHVIFYVQFVFLVSATTHFVMSVCEYADRCANSKTHRLREREGKREKTAFLLLWLAVAKHLALDILNCLIIYVRAVFFR